MTARFGGEDALQIVPHHQAGDSRVAAEELVGDREDAHVGSPQAVDQWSDDPRTELAGEDADRRVTTRCES